MPTSRIRNENFLTFMVDACCEKPDFLRLLRERAKIGTQHEQIFFHLQRIPIAERTIFCDYQVKGFVQTDIFLPVNYGKRPVWPSLVTTQ